MCRGKGPGSRVPWPPATHPHVCLVLSLKNKATIPGRDQLLQCLLLKHRHRCGPSPLQWAPPQRMSARLSRTRLRALVRALKAAALYKCFSKREILQAFRAVASSTSTGPRPKMSRSSSLFWRWCKPDPSTSLRRRRCGAEPSCLHRAPRDQSVPTLPHTHHPQRSAARRGR